MPFPVPPQTQALNSKTFKPPPLDGSLTFPELYDWHYHNTPDHPIFIYADGQGAEHTILWPEAVRAVHQVGRILHKRIGPVKPGSDRQIVAILTAADTITYLTNIVGIIRAGYIVFLISPRNSPTAIAHLLSKVHVTHILGGPEDSLQDLLHASLQLIPDDPNRATPTLSLIPQFEELYLKDATFEPLPFERPQLSDRAVILHSSGSTAFPKPITWTHYHMLQSTFVPYFGERDLTGKRLACHSMPMYHGMGMSQAGLTAACAISYFVFLLSQRRGRATQLMWSICGVSPVFSMQGVSIFVLYGSTEVGIMSPIMPEKPIDDWDYFRISGSIKARFIPDGHGHFEFVIMPNPFETPCVLNTTIDGEEAYATSDLLVPHPTKPGYWKIYGRSDDQIMHNTGEKTNPGPLENILNQDPHVLSSVMFGRGRFNAGVLIDPRPAFKFDPKNAEELAAFRNKIWPTVERMNEYAPQHSRIFKEMILVASPSKPFTYTAKNTARRQAIINDYEGEIDALYDAVAETTQADIAPPSAWSKDETLAFVRTVHGCDSLQATWIRNSVLNALRVTKIDTRKISPNFVYQNPSIVNLAEFVSKVASSAGSHSVVDVATKISAMNAMLEKYSGTFSEHTGSATVPDQDTVLVTGTTGGLGTLLLVQLLQDPKVARVYALNRRSSSGISLLERQKAALENRGLDASIVESPKLVLLEVDLHSRDFGLTSGVLDEIRNSCTHIIHNAYRVDFNITLETFEPHVQALRYLIDLALSSSLASPPRLLFTSSVSVVRNVQSNAPVEETYVDAPVAIGNGYSESKWVSERLLAAAASKTRLQPVVVRVGQLSGSNSGAWNSTDWVPVLIRSSIHVGCLPDSDKEIAWIPADTAATCLIEMRNSPVPVLHLVHPKPVPWSTIFQYVANTYNIPLVSYTAWLDLLEESNKELEKGEVLTKEVANQNPALLLLDFFRAIGSVGDDAYSEAMGLARLSVAEAQRVCRGLKDENIVPLGAEDVGRWLAYWKSVGFLPSQ
ncbi:L-aminoadipate-semialdehyde dehydrogenase large subunit [Grifola frondosa]|uniref:L-aminoadipate-semialdehyde dehydrogenase large subunit n=1 Tax=Grifola frondosa TaxID=5627 RepID=A0A1C7MT16_GRIFR|nr:L-aminoadipate-semialdehyde dehydrogenase large subunit [Grifola frondosa]